MSHLSDLVLDRLVASETDRPVDPAVARHLTACSRCHERLESFRRIRQEGEETIDRLVSSAQAATVHRSSFMTNESAQFWFRQLVLAATIGCVATVAFVMLRQPTFTTPVAGKVDDWPAEIRSKGESIHFFRQRAGAVTPGMSGDVFLPGDALRFVVSATAEPTYLLLTGIESSGEVSAYFPFGGSSSEQLAAGAETTLPGSIVLDASPDTEYLLAIFSPTPIHLAEVTQAVAAVRSESRLSPLELPALERLGVPGHHHWIVVRKH